MSIDDPNFDDIFRNLNLGNNEDSGNAQVMMVMFFSLVLKLIETTIAAGKSINLAHFVPISVHMCSLLVKACLVLKKEDELILVLIYVNDFLNPGAYDTLITTLSPNEKIKIASVVTKRMVQNSKGLEDESSKPTSHFYEEGLAVIKEALGDSKKKPIILPISVCQSMIDHYANKEDYETCDLIKKYVSSLIIKPENIN